MNVFFVGTTHSETFATKNETDFDYLIERIMNENCALMTNLISSIQRKGRSEII